jgi:hypothetical protein
LSRRKWLVLSHIPGGRIARGKRFLGSFIDKVVGYNEGFRLVAKLLGCTF